MEIVIKSMETGEEIAGKGRVHYRAWQEAYAGLIDCDYLAGMSEEKCIKQAYQWRENVLVAKDGDGVIGFVGAGRSFDADYGECGEIYALYILSKYYGKGVGYALMNAAFERLSGCKRVILWVLRGNERAIKFYERYGFQVDGMEKEILIGAPRVELRMVYDAVQN